MGWVGLGCLFVMMGGKWFGYFTRRSLYPPYFVECGDSPLLLLLLLLFLIYLCGVDLVGCCNIVVDRHVN